MCSDRNLARAFSLPFSTFELDVSSYAQCRFCWSFHMSLLYHGREFALQAQSRQRNSQTLKATADDGSVDVDQIVTNLQEKVFSMSTSLW